MLTDFEIFDEDTTREIKDEHTRDMEEAARAIGESRCLWVQLRPLKEKRVML